MTGDIRILPKLYREMARDEKLFREVSTAAQDAHATEDTVMLFEQMMEIKNRSVTQLALSSAYQSFIHETTKFAVTNSA